MEEEFETTMQRYGISTDDMTLSEMIILIELFMILVHLSKLMWLDES